jgi:hypothetical protein
LRDGQRSHRRRDERECNEFLRHGWEYLQFKDILSLELGF